MAAGPCSPLEDHRQLKLPRRLVHNNLACTSSAIRSSWTALDNRWCKADAPCARTLRALPPNMPAQEQDLPAWPSHMGSASRRPPLRHITHFCLQTPPTHHLTKPAPTTTTAHTHTSTHHTSHPMCAGSSITGQAGSNGRPSDALCCFSLSQKALAAASRPNSSLSGV